MRRSFALACAFLTVGLGSFSLLGVGCGSSLAVQDLCGFLGDENNCYRRLAMGAVDAPNRPLCGVKIEGAYWVDDNDSINDPATGMPYEVNKKPTFGGFLKRDMLDTCILTGPQGGQIIFDPPLDPNLFPPTGFTFKMIDGNGDQCGSGSFNSVTSFSIGFAIPTGPTTGTTTSTGTGGAGGSTGMGGTGGSTGTGTSTGTSTGVCLEYGPDGTTTSSSSTGSSSTGTGTSTSTVEPPICAGTFSANGTDQPQIIDTVCPDGDTYRFNLYQLNKCEQYRGILPAAEVEVNAGAIGKPGYVRFFVYWPPPVSPWPPNDPAWPHTDANGVILDPLPPPTKVEYFHCTFPGPPEPCKDGVQNGSETDIDCGRDCTTKCVDGQGCIDGLDCGSGVCTPNAMGIKKCVGDAPAPTCVGCKAAFAGPNPDVLPICTGNSTTLFDNLVACACDTSCAVDCGADFCMNMPISTACDTCLKDTAIGCGNDYDACIADL